MEAGIQETHAVIVSDNVNNLSSAARGFARKLAVEPASIEQSDYALSLADGLTDAQYVEIVGLVSRLTNIDIVARGVGVEPLSLPKPATGKPSGERSAVAIEEGAWVATVPAGKRGGEAAKTLYGGAMMPFIIRALSLLPAETRDHLELEQAQYLPLHRFAEFDYQHHEGLTRPQVEVIAGRVSVLNDCFY